MERPASPDSTHRCAIVCISAVSRSPQLGHVRQVPPLPCSPARGPRSARAKGCLTCQCGSSDASVGDLDARLPHYRNVSRLRVRSRRHAGILAADGVMNSKKGIGKRMIFLTTTGSRSERGRARSGAGARNGWREDGVGEDFWCAGRTPPSARERAREISGVQGARRPGLAIGHANVGS
jgi:hypothetical protein